MQREITKKEYDAALDECLCELFEVFCGQEAWFEAYHNEEFVVGKLSVYARGELHNSSNWHDAENWKAVQKYSTQTFYRFDTILEAMDFARQVTLHALSDYRDDKFGAGLPLLERLHYVEKELDEEDAQEQEENIAAMVDEITNMEFENAPTVG